MKKIIIGVHGLGNKPPADVLEKWWAASIQEGLAAIGELPLEQRDALLLQEQGFSLAEIVEITGTGEETIKSRLRYARKQLRKQLGGEE